MSFKEPPDCLWAATQRAKQVPLKVEQPDPRRPQADFEDKTSRFVPVVGKLVRADPSDGEIVTVFEKVCESMDDGKFQLGRFCLFDVCDQLLFECRQLLQIEGGL